MAVSAAYIEDVLLVDRCLGGEQVAARELFRRHRGRVHASLYRVLGSNREYVCVRRIEDIESLIDS